MRDSVRLLSAASVLILGAFGVGTGYAQTTPPDLARPASPPPAVSEPAAGGQPKIEHPKPNSPSAPHKTGVDQQKMPQDHKAPPPREHSHAKPKAKQEKKAPPAHPHNGNGQPAADAPNMRHPKPQGPDSAGSKPKPPANLHESE